MIRLVRKPSLWMISSGRLIFAVVWGGIFIVASVWMWIHRFGMPAYGLVILAIFDVITIAVAWDVVGRFRLTRLHREPIVEVDKEPAAYGDSVKVRIADPHPELTAEIGVKLVGECYAKAVREFTAHRETVMTLTRCYEDEALRVTLTPGEALDRTVQMLIPQSPPAEEMLWKIVVESHLRDGDVIEHPFPLRVS
jgi:hypothetical protein